MHLKTKSLDRILYYWEDINLYLWDWETKLLCLIKEHLLDLVKKKINIRFMLFQLLIKMEFWILFSFICQNKVINNGIFDLEVNNSTSCKFIFMCTSILALNWRWITYYKAYLYINTCNRNIISTLRVKRVKHLVEWIY